LSQADLGQRSSCLQLSFIAGITEVYHHAWFVVGMGSH
jgi:hypothetical protein